MGESQQPISLPCVTTLSSPHNTHFIPKSCCLSFPPMGNSSSAHQISSLSPQLLPARSRAGKWMTSEHTQLHLSPGDTGREYPN